MEQRDSMQSDHDLLIQLNVNVTAMRSEMQASSQSSSAQFTDHETRIRVLERQSNNLLGGSSAAKWLIGILLVIAGLVEPVLMYYLTAKG